MGVNAEYVIARADFVYSLPPDADPVEMAPLLCAGIIGYRAFARCRARPGARLGLFGFGGSAHIVMQIARYRGCRVFVFSRGGELRMTDLATKVFSSRSAMTRRVDRMIDEELVRRARSEADGREVVIALTPAGLTRLIEAVPVHLAGVSALFIERLDDDELAVLESALNRVSTDCSFG